MGEGPVKEESSSPAESPEAAPGGGGKYSFAEYPPGGFAWLWPSVAIFLVWFVIDHAVKWWAETSLQFLPSKSIEVIPGFFNLTYAQNTGAAFSMFSGMTGALAVVSLAASGMFSWLWWRLPAGERWGRAAVALILSGAIGNFIDRAFRGFVVDMFHAYYGAHHWPIFNVADSCICVGAAILVLRSIKGKV